MKTPYKLLFNILIGCMIPIYGSTDQISQDHRHFIWYLVNDEKINLPVYIFHHLFEAINESMKHKKRNIPYARLLSELFHQGRLIGSLRTASTYDDLEETHGNILSTSIMDNMKLLKKDKMVISEVPLKVRNVKSAYLEDFPMITKPDNLEVIKEFIKMEKRDICVILTYEDIPDGSTDMYRPSRKIKQVASDDQKIVQKPLKNKVIQQKEIIREEGINTPHIYYTQRKLFS